MGSGNDYVGYATTGLISSAAGGFSISGVKSENGVGVAALGGGGILGSNEYSVQINTNDNKRESASFHRMAPVLASRATTLPRNVQH